MLIRRNFVLLLATGLLLALAAGGTARAQLATQVDDFEDGTTADWIVGGASPNPPVNIATGGPAGLGDSFMQLTSTGTGGPGSRMIVFNTAQWADDYIAAGITAIQADVRNPSATDLSLRLVFQSQGFDYFATSVAVPVAAQSDWATITIPILPSDLEGVGLVFDTPIDALSDPREIRLISAVLPSHQGDNIVATLDIDNIRAVTIPEPASIAMLAGIAGVTMILRRCLK